MGLTDLMTPTVCGICTFDLRFSGRSPDLFCRLTVVYEGHFVVCCKEKLESLDGAMANFTCKRS